MTSHGRAMLRLALTPRWLVAALVLLVLIAAGVLLGRWQWDRTQTILTAERAAVAQPIPVQDVFPDDAADPAEVPAEGIGRPVTVSGEYVDGMQTLVTSRELDGKPGVWVVDGVDLGDGTIAAVLRGWLPDGADPGVEPPDGRRRHHRDPAPGRDVLRRRHVRAGHGGLDRARPARRAVAGHRAARLRRPVGRAAGGVPGADPGAADRPDLGRALPAAELLLRVPVVDLRRRSRWPCTCAGCGSSRVTSTRTAGRHA